MKKYIEPQISIIEAKLEQHMLTESIPVGTQLVDPGNALAPEFGKIEDDEEENL